MRILHVLHGFPPETSGGTERAVEALARAMQRAGCEVSVLAGSLQIGDPAQVGEEDLAGLRVLRVHRDDLFFESWFKTYAPGVSATFRRVLGELRPDVVHVHHWLRLTSDLVRSARAAGCTAVVTCHDYFSVLARPVRLVGEETVVPPQSPPYLSRQEVAEAFTFHRRDLADELRAAHLRLAPSRAQAAGVRQLAGEDLGGPFQIAPPPHLEAPLRPFGERPAHGRRLLTWGSLYPEKGIESVLAALARTEPALGWGLTVLGEAHDPQFRAHLEQQARGLPVTWRGRFTPEDLQRCAADYAILPSLADESYGLVLDEAMQLGLPILAADVPAYRERAQPGCCIFYRGGDAAALAAVLRDVAALERLQRPSAPALPSADAAAAALVASYRAVDRSAPGAFRPAVSEAERTHVLWRRAERRLWTALQQARPPAPPW